MSDTNDNGGWRKNVLMWDWHTIALAGYPGWDRDGDHPPFVQFAVVKGKARSSRDIAIEFDDIAEGRFYYRDWTQSGLPFVSDGESYQSGFWFEKRSDAEAFRKRYLAAQ